MMTKTVAIDRQGWTLAERLAVTEHRRCDFCDCTFADRDTATTVRVDDTEAPYKRYWAQVHPACVDQVLRGDWSAYYAAAAAQNRRLMEID